MKIKYLYIDNNGKITITRKELDEIMTQCYNEGYEDGKRIYGGYYSLNGITCTSSSDSTIGTISYDSATTSKAYKNDVLTNGTVTVTAEFDGQKVNIN
jgi:hypothetical protein